MVHVHGLQRINQHGPGHPLAWIVWAVPAFFFLYEYILRILPGMIEQTLEREFAINESEMGGALGMYYFAYAPMQLVVGILLDRYGARVLLAGAAVLCVIGMTVFAMSSTQWGLAGSRFLVGFGSSFAFIGAVYVAMVWFPVRQVPLLTGLTAGLGFGIGIGGELFAHQLLGSPPAWRAASVVLAIVGMITAVGVLAIVPRRPTWHLDRNGNAKAPTIARAASGLLLVMSRPRIWLISLGCALVYLPLPLAANWGPRSIGELLGCPYPLSTRLFAWFYLGIAIGCPVIGWLNSRFGGARPILLLGSLTTSVALLVLSTVGSSTEPATSTGLVADGRFTALLLLLLGLATSSYVLGYPLAAALSPGDAKGSALALVNFVAMMAAFGFVWLFGVVVDALASTRGHPPAPDPGDFRSALLWTGVLVATAMICFAMVPAPRRSPA